MSYRKWNEEEDRSRNIIDNGSYKARIIACEETKSQGGITENGEIKPILPMLVLDLSFIDNNGRERKIKDWIMLDGDMSWKYRHVCQSVGLIEAYDNDTITPSMLLNKYVIIDIKARNQKDKEGKKVIRNTIMDYLSFDSKPVTKYETNDGIPF